MPVSERRVTFKAMTTFQWSPYSIHIPSTAAVVTRLSGHNQTLQEHNSLPHRKVWSTQICYSLEQVAWPDRLSKSFSTQQPGSRADVSRCFLPTGLTSGRPCANPKVAETPKPGPPPNLAPQSFSLQATLFCMPRGLTPWLSTLVWPLLGQSVSQSLHGFEKCSNIWLQSPSHTSWRRSKQAERHLLPYFLFPTKGKHGC